MARSVRAWKILLAIQVAAYLPIWRWYLARMTDGSDEPWGLFAVSAALIALLVSREKRVSRDSDFLVPSVLIFVYAATYWHVPRLAQAMIAMTALSCTLSAIALGVRVHLPTLGMLLLSLPMVPSLQFYLGYPMRVLCGALTVPLLQLGGIAVVRDGTSLRWGSEIVSIDAPCSGVKMLWAGLFLAFILSSLLRLGPLRTVLAAVTAVCAVIFGNVWRSAALFYLESNILTIPEWCHEAVGVAVFTGVAVFILWFADRLGGRGLSRVVFPLSRPEPENETGQSLPLFKPRHGDAS